MSTQDINPVIDAIPGRSVPSQIRMAGFAGIGIGVLALAYGFLTGQMAWTWGAFLVALLYTMAVSQGGIMFAVILTLTEGRWGVSIKRIAESFSFFMPVAYLLLVLFLIFGNGLYPWHEGQWLLEEPVDIHPHSPAAWSAKEIWLDLPFFIARHVIGFALLIGLNFLYLRASLGPDLMTAEARLKQTNASFSRPGWWGWFIGGATDVDAVVAGAEKKRRVAASLIALTYPMVFSMLAFDLVMSLAPWWFANMFGAWFFVSSFWISLAALGFVMMLVREPLGIAGFVRSNVSLDVGKFTLALCMFWAYTLFAQILPIWYANMPEETDFLLIRMRLPEWAWLARTVAVMCFVTPFTILVSRGVKKMKWPFVGVMAIILVGMFLERTLLVMPSVYFEGTFPWVSFLIISVGIWLGFLGAFVTVFSTVLAKLPAVPITDPHLETHPWDQHVHSLDLAHH